MSAAPPVVGEKKVKRSIEHWMRVAGAAEAQEASETETSSRGAHGRKRRRHVVVLYVGGTLGMKLNEKHALEPEKGYLTNEMKTMHELKQENMPTFEIIEYDNLVDSSDMGPEDWLTIAKDVERRYHDGDGFLIAHGTDTMHYTATALSFLLHNVGKPVIVTGAMVPLAEPYNDARRNLIVAMMFAANPKISEVCLYCNEVLVRGNRAVKLRHTVAAFDSPNYPPLVKMEANRFTLREDLLVPHPTGPMAIHSNMDGRVMSFIYHPDSDIGAIESVLRPCPKKQDRGPGAEESKDRDTHLLDAVVIELTGVGDKGKLWAKGLSSIVDLANANHIVPILTNQEIQGPMGVWDLAKLQKLCPDAVVGLDMTTEAAVVKAMYLFGRGMDAETVKTWMPKNIRGELTPPRSTANL